MKGQKGRFLLSMLLVCAVLYGIFWEVQRVNNMEEKMQDSEFLEDTRSLLRPDIKFDPQEAYERVYNTLIDKMAGKRNDFAV